MHGEALLSTTLKNGIAGKPAQVGAIEQTLILKRPLALKQFGKD